MNISPAANQPEWDSFLSNQTFRPFLQGWTMGLVYADIGQDPIRLIVRDDEKIKAICFGHIVSAKRGKHLSIPYGPVLCDHLSKEEKDTILVLLLEEIKIVAKRSGCSFVRMSPFWPEEESLKLPKAINSPLHLLAEHLWYLPLTEVDTWEKANGEQPIASSLFKSSSSPSRLEESLLSSMRSTTRNLIRRAERDGVTVIASQDPMHDLSHFIRLHDETRIRHRFTPYSHTFFESQVKHFALRKELTLYLARYQGNVIAASIHMHAFGETSYHHGASDSAHSKVPASYLLQWTAIKDARKRGDRIYNFWGIAPLSYERLATSDEQNGKNTSQSSLLRQGSGGQAKLRAQSTKHPFSGVTLFKTGFGGKELELRHCMDVPLKPTYWLTYGFEMLRRWRRGF